MVCGVLGCGLKRLEWACGRVVTEGCHVVVVVMGRTSSREEKKV